MQFAGKDNVEEIIFKNQLKRLNKIGIFLPPYEVMYHEPVTDWNGSFYGVIRVKFNECLAEDYYKELKIRIQNADPSELWEDGCLNTRIVIFLYKNYHEMQLLYGRKDSNSAKGFNIKDYSNVTECPFDPFEWFLGKKPSSSVTDPKDGEESAQPESIKQNDPNRNKETV